MTATLTSESPAGAQTTDGTCGTKPSTCAVGTVSGPMDNGATTSWTCVGSGGSNAWCTLPDTVAASVNGTCGSTASSCATGTVAGSSDNGQTTSWACDGSGSGLNAWCTISDAPTVNVSGTCGTAPSSCATGTVVGSSDNGNSTSWSCNGSGSGSNSYCTVSDKVAANVSGACGTAPSTCAAGSVANASDNGATTSWACNGSGSGSNAWCTVYDSNAGSVSGACGTMPSTCQAGTVTSSSNNGASTSWACNGSGSGSNAWCTVSNTAAAPINGSCGTAASTCASGSVTGSSDNGKSTSWTCTGSGGSNAFCSVTDPTAVNGACGTLASTCAAGTVTGSYDSGYAASWSCAGIGTGSTTASCSVSESNSVATSKLGINLGWVLDYSDQQMMFVDLMKAARGFATPAHYYDPVAYPVPLDTNGWPTTDFGVLFLSNPADPLGRPLTTTFPSMFGTYSLSFSGKATVSGADCCTVQNLAYNPATNTTTGSVVVSSTDTLVALTFTGTSGGVQNLRLLRPGYAQGTTQVFTTQFLNAIAPFSTLRFMDTLETNGNPVTSWAERTLPTTPTQSASTGLAWEYVFQLANASGKDIWVNIPEGVNLADTSSNNYATQLAQLMKASLNSGINVYLEYSNEVWNSGFPQYQSNLNAAVSDVNSSADPTLNYDNVGSPYYWASRRAMHQTLRISQLFRSVYGAAAINTTIRPLYLQQYVQPYLTEDALAYLNTNFGAPNQFIYGIGGAPYFGGSQTDNYADVNSAMAALTSGLSAIKFGFPTQPYAGKLVYSNLSLKGFADFYGLKSVSYEGGPALSDGTSAAINEQVEGNSGLTSILKNYLGNWFGCGNDLFMYYELAEAPGNVYGAYEDLSIATPKSLALSTVASTPLSSYTSCTAQ